MRTFNKLFIITIKLSEELPEHLETIRNNSPLFKETLSKFNSYKEYLKDECYLILNSEGKYNGMVGVKNIGRGYIIHNRALLFHHLDNGLLEFLVNPVEVKIRVS